VFQFNKTFGVTDLEKEIRLPDDESFLTADGKCFLTAFYTFKRSAARFPWTYQQ
jgi:hypothetical protein